jgi:hypothetical protein
MRSVWKHLWQTDYNAAPADFINRKKDELMKIVKTGIVGVALGFCSMTYAAGEAISVSSAAKYYDEKVISPKIVSECSSLGSQFSGFTKEYLEKEGWQVSLVDNVDSVGQGTKLKLEITNASSSGNAFIGHHKSVSISASLYKDGKLVDTLATSRDSGGGAFAGFKGSCAVLTRCVNTLGSDVAKWVNKSR